MGRTNGMWSIIITGSHSGRNDKELPPLLDGGVGACGRAMIQLPPLLPPLRSHKAACPSLLLGILQS
ncbi:unnamed protein product [Musa acuminata subsp. malaccensis]|nr:unnamed protein product [Musa acuminata subsp. malaccensis]